MVCILCTSGTCRDNDEFSVLTKKQHLSYFIIILKWVFLINYLIKIIKNFYINKTCFAMACIG